MFILTNENKSIPLSHIPEEIFEDEDIIHYGVLDYSDKDDVDYKFYPLRYLEKFSFPCANLQIGKFNINLPLDWSIIIGDKNTGEMELMEISQINGRDYSAFIMNPLGYMPDFAPISINDIYTNVKWTFPKLKTGHLLTIPLSGDDKSPCVYACKDRTKLPDSFDINQMV